MYYIILILTAVLTAWCCAEEQQSLPVEASLSDGARLQQRWNDSLYAKIWNDPVMEESRATFEKKLAVLNAKAGYDIRALILSLRSADVRLIDITKSEHNSNPTMIFIAQAEMTGLTADIFQKWNELSSGQPAIVDAADAAFATGGDSVVTMAKFGATVVAGTAPIAPFAVPADDSDLHVALDLKKYMELIFQNLPNAETKNVWAGLEASMAQMPGWFHYDLTLVPEGLLERMSSPVAMQGFKPVDVAVLDRFPASTLMAAGIALDGKTIWSQGRDGMLKAIGALQKKQDASPDDVAAQINGQMSAIGVTVPIDQIIQDINGTFAIAVMPSSPFPTVGIVFPQSQGLEQLLAFAVAQLPAAKPIALPAVGERTLLPIPNVPLLITLTRNDTHWLITSDVQFAEQWASGASGGWKRSVAGALALSKAPADAYIIGGSDTCAVVQTASPFLAMSAGKADPAEQEKLVKFLDHLASIVSPGYVVAGTVNGQSVTEQRGLFGGTFATCFTTSIVAGIALPAIFMNRMMAQPAQPVPAF